MANTVSSITYANTFAEWVVSTNALVKENNDLAANNYTKPTGTLYLNDPTLALQSANTIVAGQLAVQGIGSSAYIQNNLRVDTQVYFTNTQLGLTNSGQANIGGPLLALGTGTGLSVSNTANVGDALNVQGVTTLSNTTNITGNTTISNTLFVSANTTVGGNVSIAKHAYIGEYLTVYDDINAYTLHIGNLATANAIISNTTISANGTTYTDRVQANTSANTRTLSVTGTTYTDILQANNTVNTRNLSITSNVYAGNVLANTAVSANTFVVNDSVYFNSTDAHFANTVTASMQVNGQFTIAGQTVYATNNFTMAAGVVANQNGYVNVYRPSPVANGSNASIRWNESQKYWDILDVGANGTYSKVLTANLISDSVSSTSQTTIASSKAANTLNDSIVTANTSMKSYVDNTVTTANTSMKSYVDGLNTTEVTNRNTAISTANTSMKSYVDNANTSMKSYVDGANTSMKSYVDSRSTANIAENSSYLYHTDARSRSSISVTGSLSYSSTTGIISYTTPNTSGIAEGTNLYLTAARVRANISATGSLSYNSSTGVMSYTTPDTAGIAENSANLYFTTARARASISASGSLSYNNSTGVISYSTPTTDGISEGSTNLYHTTARARASISASGSLSYNSSTGVISFTQATINYDNDSNSTYQVLWGSGSTGFYGTGGIYVNPYYDSFYCNGDITAYASSDRKFKENIREIPNALEKVDVIGGKLFDWTDDFLNSRGGQDNYHHVKEDLGVIAQDVQSVLPVAVRTREDGSLAVNYEKLVGLAFQAIKELKAEVEELKKQLP